MKVLIIMVKENIITLQNKTNKKIAKRYKYIYIFIDSFLFHRTLYKEDNNNSDDLFVITIFNSIEFIIIYNKNSK